MTRYFLDTEFIDNGHTIDLISIGIVAEDGRELYLQSTEFDWKLASAFVQEQVFPHLHLCQWAILTRDTRHPYRNDIHYHKGQGQCVDQQRGRIHNCLWRTRQQMRCEIESFMGTLNPDDTPEIWGWCSGYDFVALCQLFGTMMDIPDGWPHYIRDFQQILDGRLIADSSLPEQEEGLHNALEDARHLKKLWGYIVRNDAWQ